MQRDGIIKISLGQARLNRNCRCLEDFGAVRPDHVEAKHTARLGVGHHLVKRSLIPVSKHVFHRAEIRTINAHLAKFGAGFVLGHADACYGRVGKHSSRDAAIIDGARIAAKHTVSKGMALADGNRRELYPVSYITNRIDARDVGAVIIADDHRAFLTERNPRRFKPKSLRVRHTTNCPKNQVSLNHPLIATID